MTDHIEFLYDTVVKLRPGLKSRRVMVDKEKKLSEFSTADLVRELCSREGVVEITLNRNDSCLKNWRKFIRDDICISITV